MTPLASIGFTALSRAIRDGRTAADAWNLAAAAIERAVLERLIAQQRADIRRLNPEL